MERRWTDTPASVSPDNLHTGKVGILIADDFEPWRVEVRELLAKRSDWLILGEACDGREAIQKSAELKPGVVVLDIGMPRLSGLAAAEAIREVSPGSRIVFLTQLADKAFVDAALAAGAEGYVVKTNAARELISTIANALRGAVAEEVED